MQSIVGQILGADCQRFQRILSFYCSARHVVWLNLRLAPTANREHLQTIPAILFKLTIFLDLITNQKQSLHDRLLTIK